MGRILRRPGAADLIREVLPALGEALDQDVIKGLSLETIARFADEASVHDSVADLLEQLRALPEPPHRPAPSRQEVSADYEGPDIGRGSATVAAPRHAHCWDTVEIEVSGPGHGNPFLDVHLTAEVSSPGRHYLVPGFYDGNGTYRIRVLAEELGTWTWRTTSNARSLDGLEGSFVVTAPRDGAHGLVRVVDTFHFAFDDGTPYRPIGTTCYAWTHQEQELATQTLTTLADTPFDKVRMCVFPKSYEWNDDEPAFHAFPRGDDGQWDLERFEPRFFANLERRIAQLGHLGIQADVILFHPYDRWGYEDLGAEVDDRYVRYVVARLSAMPNVWWALANEWDFVWQKDENDWDRLGALVAHEDPFGHLRSIHNGFVHYDHSRSWITHCSVQRVDRYLTAENTDSWRDAWGKPVVIDECGYEGDVPHAWGNLTGEELVRRFWEATVRGGYLSHGETYLDPGDVLWWSKGGALKGESPDRLAFLRQILDELPAGLTPVPGSSAIGLPMARSGDGCLLGYLGNAQPRYVEHRLPVGRWSIEVLDTWAMTVADAGTHEDTVRIDLPGRPYLAIRMTRTSPP